MPENPITSRAEPFLWKSLLFLICVRPFLSEYAFLTVGVWYIFFLVLFSLAFLILFGKKAFLPLHLNVWPLLFTIVILFSISLSGWAKWSLVEFYFFIPNILIFYIAARIKPSQQRQLLAAVFITATIICIYAVYQYFFGLRHTLEYLSPEQQSSSIGKFLRSRRVFATFISPNIFASYIIMMLFVSIGLFRSSWRRGRLTYFIGIAAMVLSLLYTKSVGGILVFVITFLLFIPHLFPSFSFKKINVPRFAFIAALIACIFVLMCRLLFWERLLQVFDLRNPNNSIVQRIYYWKASMNMIKEYPFTGIGWRKFGALYEFYKSPLANTSHYSHNVFLQVLVETGLTGLASFLLIVITFLRNGLAVIVREGTQLRALKVGLFYAGCAFLIHNVVDLSFYFGQAGFFWWMIAGLFSNFRLENV